MADYDAASLLMTSSSARFEAALPLVRSKRIDSIDALCGFDMFWIIGGDHLLRSLPDIHDNIVSPHSGRPDGACAVRRAACLRPDLPDFCFHCGCCNSIFVAKTYLREGRPSALRRVIIRGVILFLLGVFYMGGVDNGFSNVYFAGVLRSASGWLICSRGCFSYSFAREHLGIIAGTLLIVYWACLHLSGSGNRARVIRAWQEPRILDRSALSTRPEI